MSPHHRLRPRNQNRALPLTILTTALWLALWVASGSFALAVADGLGAHPVRRLSVGLVLVLATALGLWQRERVCASLRKRPWLVLVLGAIELGLAAIDGLVGGPYMAFTLTSIGFGVIVAAPRLVWWCVALLVCGYMFGVLLNFSPAALVHQGKLASVIGQVLGYPFAALILLALANVYSRFEHGVEPLLTTLRHGAPALTPALAFAIQHPGQPLLLPAGRSSVRLTAMEIRVVEGLARGNAPKQLAYQWGVSLSTVRSHIKHAKRKTGARTLPELAALAAQPDWPEVPGRGG